MPDDGSLRFCSSLGSTQLDLSCHQLGDAGAAELAASLAANCTMRRVCHAPLKRSFHLFPRFQLRRSPVPALMIHHDCFLGAANIAQLPDRRHGRYRACESTHDQPHADFCLLRATRGGGTSWLCWGVNDTSDDRGFDAVSPLDTALSKL